ncbi:MAG TPA: hypothetical protein VLK33_05105 [Terriglobales bacterium]|nr:hypothetical protein [Terriglobales bacterium]
MDANIRFMQFASTWFKIFSGVFLVGGILLTIGSNIPGVVALFAAGATLNSRGGGAGFGVLTGALALIVVAIELLAVALVSFVLYTIARVLDFLADMGDEIFGLFGKNG